MIIIIIICLQDTRFKLFPNGTLRINSVEVYDGVMYSCQSRTVGGNLTAQARVFILGELLYLLYL